MILWDIYQIPLSKKEVREILFRWLAEREEISNISHRAMPTWEFHCKYVDSKPHLAWWFIMHPELPELPVGHAYVSQQCEIGIQIAREYRGNGFAKAALRHIVDEFHDVRLLANINPANAASIALFAKFGFQHIQNTYSREP